MAINFYSSSNASRDLPEKYRRHAEGAIRNPADNYPLSIDAPGPVSPIPLLVAGSFLMLGALFIILAAHQILPNDINAISELGAGGRAIGYGILSLGLIPTLISAVLFSIASCRKYQFVNYVHNNAVLQFVSDALQPHEIFVVDNPETKSAYILHYQTQDPGHPKHVVHLVKALVGYETTAHDKYLEYVAEHNLSDKRPVPFRELQSRTKP